MAAVLRVNVVVLTVVPFAGEPGWDPWGVSVHAAVCAPDQFGAVGKNKGGEVETATSLKKIET